MTLETTQDDGSDGERVEDLDPSLGDELNVEGSDPDGSADDDSGDDGEFGFEVDLADLPEDVREAVEAKLAGVKDAANKYIGDTREKESSELAGLKDTAAAYDKLVQNPAFRRWATQQAFGGKEPKEAAPVEKKEPEKVLDSERLFELLEKPDQFTEYLESGMRKMVAQGQEEFKEKEIKPLYAKQEDEAVAAEIAFMDKTYPDWKKHTPTIMRELDKQDKHGVEMDIPTAYQLAVELPKLKKANVDAQLKAKNLRQTKKKVIQNEPKGAESKGEPTEEKTTIRGSILEAITKLKESSKAKDE